MTKFSYGLKKTALLLFAVLFVMANAAPVQAKKFDKNAAKKKITVSCKKVPEGILAVYKNKNKTAVSLTAELAFLDADKNSMSVEKQKNLCLGAKCTSAFLFRAPLDGSGEYVNYSSYSASFTVAKSRYKNYSRKISVGTNPQTVLVNYDASNKSGKNLDSIHATFLFYGRDGKLLGCQEKYLNCLEKNAADRGSIGYPHGITDPAKVKVYVDWAY